VSLATFISFIASTIIWKQMSVIKHTKRKVLNLSRASWIVQWFWCYLEPQHIPVTQLYFNAKFLHYIFHQIIEYHTILIIQERYKDMLQTNTALWL
jgi:hypothetical protein